jgi:hypothetical protein
MSRFDACAVPDAIIDQAWWADLFISGRTRIDLDYQCQIFQCLFAAKNDLEISRSGFRNRITGTRPCIIHANGNSGLDDVADHVFRRQFTLAWWNKRFRLAIKIGTRPLRRGIKNLPAAGKALRRLLR